MIEEIEYPVRGTQQKNPSKCLGGRAGGEYQLGVNRVDIYNCNNVRTFLTMG